MNGISYTDKNVETVINAVEAFRADMGGTEIYEPLLASIEIASPPGYSKKIFLLTDGEVSRPEDVI